MSIHVREGGISSFFYDPEKFTARFKILVDLIHNYRDPLLHLPYAVKGFLDEWDWGQNAMTIEDIIHIVDTARNSYPGMTIEIVTHKVDDELKSLVVAYNHAVLCVWES